MGEAEGRNGEREKDLEEEGGRGRRKEWRKEGQGEGSRGGRRERRKTPAARVLVHYWDKRDHAGGSGGGGNVGIGAPPHEEPRVWRTFQLSHLEMVYFLKRLSHVMRFGWKVICMAEEACME